MNETPWVTVYAASNHAEAQILCGLLISEGLDARVSGEGLADEFGMARKMSSAEVGVPRAQEEQAADIVKAWKARAEEHQTKVAEQEPDA